MRGKVWSLYADTMITPAQPDRLVKEYQNNSAVVTDAALKANLHSEPAPHPLLVARSPTFAERLRPVGQRTPLGYLHHGASTPRWPPLSSESARLANGWTGQVTPDSRSREGAALSLAFRTPAQRERGRAPLRFRRGSGLVG